MSTLTDQTAAIIDYLVAQCQASPLLGGANPPVDVFDGPTISDTQLVAQQRIWIGASGPARPGEPVEAGSSAQDFAFLDHARTRDNQIEVSCAAEVFDGDPVRQKYVRDGAYALVGVVELMLRGDAATGGPGDASLAGLDYWAQVTRSTLSQAQAAGGVSALVRFTVSVFTRLTT